MSGGAAEERGTVFLDPPAECADYARARFVVLPVPYEKTTTYGKGTARGPAAVIEASTQVEFYDEELRAEPCRAGIATAQAVVTSAAGEEAAAVIERAAASILADNKRFVAIGGEHTVTLGLARAVLKRHGAAAILHIDAHADLREEYEGTRYGHGTVMRRLLDEGARIVQTGIRALSIEEARIIDEGRVKTFFAKDVADVASESPGAPRAWIQEVVAALPEEVYVSLDIDGLDPSIAPGTGTPEPGGFGWYDTLALLRAVATERRIMSADLVEVMPQPTGSVTEFAAARLIHKIIGYMALRDALLAPL